MQFLHKLFFFNPTAAAVKRELFIAASAIDYMVWHKKDAAEGTMLFTSLQKQLNHVIDGVPENVNQIAFDGLFFKCTCHYLHEGGAMKKFSCWLNPDNIRLIYSIQPDDCCVYFASGRDVLICNQISDVMKALLEHKKKQTERKQQKYGKSAKK